MVHDLSRLQRSPPLDTNSGDRRQHSTTFRGASHAVSLAVPARSLPKASVGTNGALVAATSAGMGIRRQAVHLAEEATANGRKEGRHPTRTPGRSGLSKKDGSPPEQSPSYAATLHATSKSTPASMQKSIDLTSNSQQPFPLQTLMKNGAKAVSRSTDEAVAGATSSLVSLFESKHNANKDVPTTHSVRYMAKPASAIASPTPIQPPKWPALSTIDSLSKYPFGIDSAKGLTASDPSSTIETGAAAAAAKSIGPTQDCTTRSSGSAHCTLTPRTVPVPLAQRRSEARAPLEASLENGKNISRISLGSAPLAVPQAKLTEPGSASQTLQSDPAFLSAKPSSALPSRPLLPVGSIRSFEMKVSTLADTIVAASLASSRAPSPTKTPPPPPRRHRSHSLFRIHHSQRQMSRTPSPAKAMRQTMREPLPSDVDIEYNKRSISMRKHPHNHHEGDRKRYRATVTERERRRYDGVWAANKGLWMDASSSDNVLNLVVRDIWSRSRLPDDVLGDIWDLVNIHGGDRLNRSEFIVGMWLIDQRLKGRKLPFVVSESLWNSVRLLHGVKAILHGH